MARGVVLAVARATEGDQVAQHVRTTLRPAHDVAGVEDRRAASLASEGTTLPAAVAIPGEALVTQAVPFAGVVVPLAGG